LVAALATIGSGSSCRRASSVGGGAVGVDVVEGTQGAEADAGCLVGQVGFDRREGVGETEVAE